MSINTTETCTWKVSRQIAQLSMDRSVTPKKVVNKPSDYCRVCNCAFNVKYGTGKSGRISSENLFQPSSRDGSRGCVLASMCEKIGIPLVKAPSLSERVCNPCARKIRNVSKLFNDLKEATSVDGAGVKNVRSKRQLPTSVLTPDRSPANRKVSRTNRQGEPSSRKSLFNSEQSELSNSGVQEQSEPLNTGLQKPSEISKSSGNRSGNEDLLLQHSNINDLVGNEKTALKVIIVYPKGNVVVRTPADQQSKNLIKNISLKCWKAVANGVFSHVAIREEMTAALLLTLLLQFRAYCGQKVF